MDCLDCRSGSEIGLEASEWHTGCLAEGLIPQDAQIGRVKGRVVCEEKHMDSREARGPINCFEFLLSTVFYNVWVLHTSQVPNSCQEHTMQVKPFFLFPSSSLQCWHTDGSIKRGLKEEEPCEELG